MMLHNTLTYMVSVEPSKVCDCAWPLAARPQERLRCVVACELFGPPQRSQSHRAQGSGGMGGRGGQSVQGTGRRERGVEAGRPASLPPGHLRPGLLIRLEVPAVEPGRIRHAAKRVLVPREQILEDLVRGARGLPEGEEQLRIRTRFDQPPVSQRAREQLDGRIGLIAFRDMYPWACLT